jgi:hypothetical protein
MVAFWFFTKPSSIPFQQIWRDPISQQRHNWRNLKHALHPYVAGCVGEIGHPWPFSQSRSLEKNEWNATVFRSFASVPSIGIDTIWVFGVQSIRILLCRASRLCIQAF